MGTEALVSGQRRCGPRLVSSRPRRRRPCDRLSRLAHRARRTSGFASPIGSFRTRSRSPSPRAEALLAAATAQLANTTQAKTADIDIPGTSAFPRPALWTVDTGAKLTAGTSRGASLSQSASPRPLPPPALSASPSPAPSPAHSSGVTKRLSFTSYADIRVATPATTTSLTQLTSGAGNDPPPHIPGVSGLSSGGGGSAWGGSERGARSAAPSVRGMSRSALRDDNKRRRKI